MIQTRTVFLVDDSKPMRQLLSARLEELAGVQIVGQAGTVAAAIDGIERLQPEVVILDLHLADGSGPEVLGAVQQGEYPSISLCETLRQRVTDVSISDGTHPDRCATTS